ncbi:hypothetical protein IWQ60_005708 [Tieghemiomyces parasiticus]|uniref:Oxidoreductase-like domain-containing protein n=1 Tax=Tieghemiomyces parasiticus TaxID=78921 RepID=A0A9W8ADI0_9FUNG|nr:hypothetical protein IWQ60_005708 [Tieghemiomyces parasiticus]
MAVAEPQPTAPVLCEEGLQRLVAQLPSKPPEAPTSDMCCMSGCARCVWDIYNDDLQDFEKQIEAIRTAYHAAGLPPPAKLRQLETTAAEDQALNPLAAASAGLAAAPSQPTSPADAAMKAFQELERKLSQK